MFLGHFGVALAAKKAAPQTSLGTLIFAAQFADLLWPVLLLLGLERVRIVPGITRVSPFDFVSYPLTHSLLMQLTWAVLLGIVYFLARRNLQGALVVSGCVPTHWLLDWTAHRPDLPIVPTGSKHGLGLWNSLPATIVVEYALFMIGLAIYLRTTRARKRVGHFAFWSLILLLVALYLGSVFGPPPPNERVLGCTALAIWLTVPWAAWADRHRQSAP